MVKRPPSTLNRLWSLITFEAHFRHGGSLTPWQRVTARLLGWQWARIWVDGQHGEGWHYLTVRVFPDGTVPLNWTRYEQTSPPDEARDWPGLLTSVSTPAPLAHFKSMSLTERRQP